MKAALSLAASLQTGKEVESKQLHKDIIQDLQMSVDGTHFITASTDMTSKLIDTLTLEVLKSYSFERPCNSAAISPTDDHVCTYSFHSPQTCSTAGCCVNALLGCWCLNF